jgi:inosine-uridine nucleoside N-ribohydrolase/formylmethanofuran dehydrogenase subunit E
MKRTAILLIALVFTFSGFAHPWKPKYYVIVDTDAGVDDMKAISMLLASPDVRVLAIIVSPGAVNAHTGYIKVKSLLNGFFHEGIPVGINDFKGFKSPDFAQAVNARWGDENNLSAEKAPVFTDVIREIFDNEKNKISMICLGGLTTAARSLSEIPGFSQIVKRIILSSDGIADRKGFNYNIDSNSFNEILRSDIPLIAVKGTGNTPFYDSELTGKISDINNTYSQKLTEFFNSQTAKNHDYSVTLNDDAVPVFLHYPQLFTTDTLSEGVEARPSDISQIKEKSLKILKGETVDRNQVIKEMPMDPKFYFADVEPAVSDIINKYGMDEWTSGVLANELHRHLGVFAIVGVKMGIRAREYFDTGVDEFMVTSNAGSMPPLSCMNDGLQVSTGATPGHGLLTVKNDSPSPTAEFTYMNKKIRLTLKPEIAKVITGELKEINFVYGLDSDIYWELVRNNSIKYWQKLNRHDIFIIERL